MRAPGADLAHARGVLRLLAILVLLCAPALAAPQGGCDAEESALGRLARDIRSASELDLARARKPLREEPGDHAKNVVSWVGVELDDDTLVEGSWSVGGTQPDFWIDWDEATLAREIIEPARAIAAEERDIWKRIARIQSLVQKHLKRDGYHDRRYIKHNAKLLADGDRVASLGEYVELGAGVCRENALLTTTALRAAGVDARFGYFLARHKDSILGDHAIALVEIEGTTYIVDSFKPFGSVLNGHRLVDLMNPPRRAGRFAGSPLSVNNDELPIGYRLTPNDFPRVRSGEYRNE